RAEARKRPGKAARDHRPDPRGAPQGSGASRESPGSKARQGPRSSDGRREEDGLLSLEGGVHHLRGPHGRVSLLRDQPDQPDQEGMAVFENRTSGPVAGPPKRRDRPSESCDAGRACGELVTLVTRKDGDGESPPKGPGEAPTPGHLPPSNRTRK